VTRPSPWTPYAGTPEVGLSGSWIPAGRPVTVAGHRIPGGLIYVGRTLRSGSGAGAAEPAQINPALPVDPPATVRTVHGLGPTPAYHLISSGHRAAYLEWLARGRVGDDVPVGLVLLFFAGLERRVLLDGTTDPIAQDEFDVIATELRRLHDMYGKRHPLLRRQARDLLEVLELLTAPATWTPPADLTAPPPVATEGPRWPVPPALRIALAQLANSGRPVPSEWARCWAWYHPSLFPTTPQTRCPEEFTRLFALRYRSRLPSGLTPAATGRPPVRIGYQPVNPPPGNWGPWPTRWPTRSPRTAAGSPALLVDGTRSPRRCCSRRTCSRMTPVRCDR
jgi:hypothetical protein